MVAKRIASVMYSGVVTVTALAAVALLVLSSCASMHRALARGDDAAARFVEAAFVLLCALLATVRAHESGVTGDGDADRQRRRHLRAAAWALSTALTVMFAHRVSALAPAPWFAVLVWGMGATTVAGGFYCLFVLGEGH